MDGWHLVGDASTGLGTTFTSGWSNYNAATEEAAGFRKDLFGHVSFKGLVTAPAPTSIAWTMPANYRPVKTARFVCAHSAGFALVQILADGSVQFYNIGAPYTSAAGGWLDLSVVEFDTQLVTAYPAGPQGPPGQPAIRVTSLTAGVGGMPAVIYDGLEVMYQADIANGIEWHLKFNASITGAYKWDVVGGSPLEINDDSNLTLNNNSWTNGPTMIPPLAGIYSIEMDANMYFTNAVGTHQLQIITGGNQYVYATQSSQAVGMAVSVSASGRRKTLTAGQILQLQYFVPGSGGVARYRNTSLMPSRVG
jgi:hypothetical protein